MAAPVKAVIQNLHDGARIPVLYNPVQYTATSRAAVTKTETGVQFQALTSADFTVDLFFDTYEQGRDVRELIKPIAALQEPTEGTGDKREPPTCMFSWGRFSYVGLVGTLTQTFTLFKADGTPLRADVQITFISVESAREMLENAGLDNCRKIHVVRQGDRLDLLASDLTGAPGNWRAIAAANGVDDPLAFPDVAQVGAIFVIPDIGSDTGGGP